MNPPERKPMAPPKKAVVRTSRASATPRADGATLGPEYQENWAYARQAWEGGEFPRTTIAAQIGVTPNSLYHHALTHGWSVFGFKRAEVQHKANVKAALIEKEVEATLKAERVTVEMQARLLVQHRLELGRGRKLTMRLLQELEDVCTNLPELQKLGDKMRCPDDFGQDKENDLYRAILEMPGRTKSLKQIADSMKTMVLLERQAYGIVGALEDPEDPEKRAREAKDAGEDGMRQLLDKFDVILSPKATEAGPPQQLPIVEEVKPNGRS
jgi:hypothetical protein